MGCLSHARGVVAVAVFVGSTAGAAVAADSLRCGRRLVTLGDSTHRVRSVCGEPAEVVRRTESRSLVRRVPDPACLAGSDGLPCTALEQHTVDVQIEEWLYDFGSNRLQQRLEFEQGKLREIESGAYGAGSP